MPSRILLAGSTGLIGRQVTVGLAADSTIVVPVRREPGFDASNVVAVVADLLSPSGDDVLEARVRLSASGVLSAAAFNPPLGAARPEKRQSETGKRRG